MELGGLGISIDTTLIRDDSCPSVYLDGNLVVLGLHAGSYFSFNEVGTVIWDMLARPCRVRDIFDELLRRHEVDEKTLAADVRPFLEQLAGDRLVQVIDNR